VSKCEEKYVYSVHQILFHSSNKNMDPPLSSNCAKLEKQQLQNLKSPQCCFDGWQVQRLQTCQPAKHSGGPVS